MTGTTAREEWVAACKRLSFTAADHLPRLATVNSDGRLDVLVARITEAARAWEQYQEASDAEAEAGTISTADAARRLGKSITAIVELLRSGELSGYADTTPSGRVHRWRVYRESIDRYEARRAAGSPLNRARKGWAA